MVELGYNFPPSLYPINSFTVRNLLEGHGLGLVTVLLCPTGSTGHVLLNAFYLSVLFTCKVFLLIITKSQSDYRSEVKFFHLKTTWKSLI